MPSVDRVLLPSAYFQNWSSFLQRLPKAQINTLGLCCEQIQNSSSALCIMSSGSTGVLTAARNTSPYPLPALASPQPHGDRGAELAMCITLAQVKATPGYCPALDSTWGFSKMLFSLSAQPAAILALGEVWGSSGRKVGPCLQAAHSHGVKPPGAPSWLSGSEGSRVEGSADSDTRRTAGASGAGQANRQLLVERGVKRHAGCWTTPLFCQAA